MLTTASELWGAHKESIRNDYNVYWDENDYLIMAFDSYDEMVTALQNPTRADGHRRALCGAQNDCLIFLRQYRIILSVNTVSEVPQPSERCLNRKAGIVRCCHTNFYCKGSLIYGISGYTARGH